MSGLIRALIDVAALRANLAALRVAARGAKVMAVVKANAYGHGIAQVTAALELADAFAVARIEEAVALREAGVVRPIVLLEGVFTPGQLQAAAAADLELVVHDPEQLRLLEEHRGEHRFLVWFKVNTGMNRLGFRAEHCAAALERLRAYQQTGVDGVFITGVKTRADVEALGGLTLWRHRFRYCIFTRLVHTERARLSSQRARDSHM